METKKLKNSPVREAAVAVTFTSVYKELHELDPVLEELKKEYPLVHPAMNMDVGQDGKPKSEKIGYTLFSQDKKETLFLHKNRFMLVSQRKYEAFEKLYETFIRVFRILVSEKNGLDLKKAVSTAGLRYNNIFDVPVEELGRVVNFMPHFNIGSFKLAAFSGEFVLVGDDRAESLAKVMLSPAEDKKHIRLVFDATVSKEIKDFSEETLNVAFSELRVLKNELFFGNINTDIVKTFND